MVLLLGPAIASNPDDRQQALADVFAKNVFFFQAEDGIRAAHVTGVQTCALPILHIPSVRIESSRRRPEHGLGKIGRASCRERV